MGAALSLGIPMASPPLGVLHGGVRSGLVGCLWSRKAACPSLIPAWMLQAQQRGSPALPANGSQREK